MAEELSLARNGSMAEKLIPRGNILSQLFKASSEVNEMIYLECQTLSEERDESAQMRGVYQTL
jgi:hypothetical protein